MNHATSKRSNEPSTPEQARTVIGAFVSFAVAVIEFSGSKLRAASKTRFGANTTITKAARIWRLVVLAGNDAVVNRFVSRKTQLPQARTHRASLRNKSPNGRGLSLRASSSGLSAVTSRSCQCTGRPPRGRDQQTCRDCGSSFAQRMLRRSKDK